MLRQWPLAALVLIVAAGLEVRLWRKLAMLAGLLKLSRAGRGRLLLTPEHVIWPGTDVAIPWSHVQGAAIARGQRPGLDGRVACPEPDPVRACRFRGHTISFHIAESLYHTTADDIGAAFARHTHVEHHDPDHPATVGQPSG
jgi:hypothetical protein